MLLPILIYMHALVQCHMMYMISEYVYNVL